MKRTIKVTDKKTGKTTTGEVTLRNLDHFNVQLHTRAVIQTPKKGKASYKRNKKVTEED